MPIGVADRWQNFPEEVNDSSRNLQLQAASSLLHQIRAFDLQIWPLPHCSVEMASYLMASVQVDQCYTSQTSCSFSLMILWKPVQTSTIVIYFY